MLYMPDFSIYHKEDQSSIQSFNNDDLVRRRYLLRSIWSSIRIYRSSKGNLPKIIENSIKEKL